jgi:hypothetical protein
MRLQTSERVGARSKEAARLVVVAGFWEANQTFAWSDQVSLTPRTAVSVDEPGVVACMAKWRVFTGEIKRGRGCISASLNTNAHQKEASQ